MAEINNDRGLYHNSGRNPQPPLMASRRSFHNYIYTSSEFPYPTTSSNDIHEFDEAEIWSSYGVAAMGSKKKPMALYRETKKVVEKKVVKKTTNAESLKSASSSSVPLSIPDWSKILQEDHRKRFTGFEDDEEGGEDEEEEDDDDDDEKVPPHEFLARRRGASFSVHEGIGRTLKGRDLSRVRNAVWKKTGFED